MPVNKIRRNGSYAPLSAHYYKDDAIAEAGVEAELLFVRGLAFCAEVLSDGVISDRQLDRFVGVGLSDPRVLADVLVKVALWERVDNGFQVRSWLDWNRSRAEITDYHEKDRERKKARSQPSARNPDGIRSDVRAESERIPTSRAYSTTTPRNSKTLQKDAGARVPTTTARFRAAQALRREENDQK